MNVREFSDRFDVQYNNITSNQAPGLDEYEKSVFLTKAQSEIVKNYFNPKANPKQDGFDDSPKRQADFATIIESTELSVVEGIDKFDQRAISYALPTDLFIALNEQLMDGRIPITIMPLSYSDYNRLMSKPYKYPVKYNAWRLITKQKPTLSTTIVNNIDVQDIDNVTVPAQEQNISNIIAEDGNITIAEVIGRFYTNNPPRYRIRYVKKLKPIILVDLRNDIYNDLTLEGETGPLNCQLPEELHEEILQRAVELAKAAWSVNQEEIAHTNLNLTTGQRSE